jgi:PKD repeat protein
MRVNPDTGAALPDNPLFGGNPEDDRVIAYGFRNPFRFNIDQTSGNIWVGDVGWNTWEEIDRIISPIDPSVENFGWPCYEGVNRQPGYDAANLPICESLYAAGNSQPPYYQYTTSNNSAITGIVLYRGNNFPVQYRGAIFFTDYTQGWIKVMLPGANGLPDPATVTNFIPTGVFATDLQVGPGGELFYVDVVAGTAHMVKHFAQNAPPTAVAQADVTNGSAPLVVHFDGSASSDPDPGDTLTYAWDLDGDSQFDDASAVNTQYTYTINGTYSAALRVTDTSGAFSTASVVITVGNAPPIVRILTPSATTTFRAGQVISFSGEAIDPETGPIPASRLSWNVLLHHCAVADPTSCHAHFLQSFQGVAGGTIVAPDHEYPAFLEFQLTATEPPSLPGGWWDSAWSSRSKLTFDALSYNTDLVDFPALVKLDSSRIDYGRTQPNGEDLRFIDADSTTVLPYEIESWNPGGVSYVWVKVPRIDRQSSKDYIHLYYGNPGAPAGENKNAVWSNSFVGVWHLDTDLLNSASASHNGNNNASTDTAGLIAGGQAFNGINQWVSIPNAPELSFTAAQSYCISAWVNVPSLASRWQGVIVREPGSLPGYYGIWESNVNNWRYGSPGASINGTAITPGWHMVTAIQDGPLNRHYLYVDGTLVVQGPSANGVGNGALTFGRAPNSSEFFQGSLDEIRLSNTARSADWVRAHYRSTQDQLIQYTQETAQVLLSSTASVSIQPQTVTLTFQSVPSGLQLVVFGTPQTTPFSRQVIVNGSTTISATSPQTAGGTQYTFNSWSDGQAQTHVITATVPTTYTATFNAVSPPPTAQTIWRSYDVITQSGSPQAIIRDSLGVKSTILEFYESLNNGGVNRGALFAGFNAGVHSQAFNKVESYWSPVSGALLPYVGKSTVVRGSDAGETNTPSPAGVRDLQMHPPNNSHLVVAAFRIPEAGTYTLSGLAVRRVDNNPGQTVRYKVFNSQRVLIANLRATSNRAWVTDATTYSLGSRSVGDFIYFAVDRDGTWAWDATEISWIITRIGP